MTCARIKSPVAIALLAFVLVLTIRATAQEDPNEGAVVRPFAALHGSDIDHISLQNGGLAVDIPIASYPQRGGKLKLDFHLYYENRGFSTFTISQPQPAGAITISEWNGSGFSLRDMQALYLYSTENQDLYGLPNGGEQNVSFTEYAVQTMDGALHRAGNVSSTELESVDAMGFNVNLALAGCGKTRFEGDAVPRNSLVSTAQPDKKKACEETTSSSWMCSAT